MKHPQSASASALLTVDDMANHIRVNPMTIRRWIRDGKIPSMKLGHLVRVNSADFEAFLAQGEVR